MDKYGTQIESKMNYKQEKDVTVPQTTGDRV